MFMTRRWKAFLVALLLGGAGSHVESGEKKPADTIVFVCEHGSVKSLIAMQWFNKRAQERGLRQRAVSRGVTPDASVPQGIVGKLREDGFAVESFTPARLSTADLPTTERIIFIGTDVVSVTKGSRVKIDEWNDIPPASEDYAASRAAILRRIDMLLTELEKGRNRAEPI